MSSLIDLIPVTKEHDGRRKISDAQRERVKQLDAQGKSKHAIAAEVGISRRSVQFILHPERLEVVKARAIEVKRWEPYNTKEYRKPVMRKHRAKKRLLLVQGAVSITPAIRKKHQAQLKKRNKKHA